MIKHLLLLAILLLAVCASVRLRKLTFWGGVAAAVVAALVFAGSGYVGVGMLVAFFLMGTFATSWKREIKLKLDPHDEPATYGRTAGQVFANGGVAAIAGLLALLFPVYRSLFELMMAASLSAATSDTLSSELGMIYGKRFYNIVTLRRDKPGLNGVVSVEGLAAGVAGSSAIALVYALDAGLQASSFILVIIAGTAGNIADSLLGATLERKKVLNNDAVNVLNTLTAALLIVGLFFFKHWL